MNFSCDRCGRLYSIADEKVLGRTFRVKCRACEHTIVVRASAPPASAPEPAAARPPPPPAMPAAPSAPRAPTPAMSDAELAWLSGADVSGQAAAPPAPAEAAPAPPAPAKAKAAPSAAELEAGALAPRTGEKPERESRTARESGTARLEEGFFRAEGATEVRAAAPARSRRALLLAAAGVVAAGIAAAIFLVPRRPPGRLTATAAQLPPPSPAPILAPEPAPEAAAVASATPAPPETAAEPVAAAPVARPPRPAAFEPVGGAAVPVRERRRQLRIATKDRKLLDLLERKQDASVAAPVEGESLDTARASLDAPAVERTIADNRRAFGACIEKAVHANPNLHVSDLRATLIVTVQPGGAVSSAWIAEEAMDKSELGRCLVRAARRMVFPAFGGDAIDVAVPLALSAVH